MRYPPGGMMFTNPKILVCTDLSEASDRALRFAQRFKEKTQGSIVLLHVAPDISFILDQYEHVAESKTLVIKENIHRRLQAQLDRCGVTGEIVLEFDLNPASVILDVTLSSKADVVVIGATGSKSQKFPLGGTARKLAARLTAPLFLIRSEFVTQNVAALVDGTEEHFESCIETARKLSNLFPSKLSVISLLRKFPGLHGFGGLEFSSPLLLKLSEEAERQNEKLKKRVASAVKNQETEVVIRSSAEPDLGFHLAEILNDAKVDTAVLRRSKKVHFEKFILGSVSARVLELFTGNVFIA